MDLQYRIQEPRAFRICLNFFFLHPPPFLQQNILDFKVWSPFDFAIAALVALLSR